MDFSWTIEKDREDDLTEPPRPLLSTWHFLRSSLRRRWRTTAGLAALGAMLGLGLVVLFPPGSTATATLLMVHPASMGGPDGSAMDVTLLSTRDVAARTVAALRLGMTPEAFRSTVTAEPVTPEVLTVTVSAPDDASAVTRGEGLVRQYLDFRATQLRSMSSGMRTEYAARVASAQQQVTQLTTQYERLSAGGAQSANQAFDALARRSELNKKIADWQETVDNATLETEAALESTHVIDPVHTDRSSLKRAVALAAGSGAIVGGALGVGIVAFRALVSDRLRRRRDVGLALGTPIRFSVRSTGPRERRHRLTRLLPVRGGWRGYDLDVLARGLESALELPSGDPLLRENDPTSGHSGAGDVDTSAAAQPHNGRHTGTLTVTSAEATMRRAGPTTMLAVAAVGNVLATADVLSSAATRLQEHGRTVFVVDLSSTGSLAGHVHAGSLQVWRPTGPPPLASGPLGRRIGAVVDLPGDSWRGQWETADVVLALVEVDPGIDAEQLATWVDRVVPVVTAGAPTAEHLSTIADLVREARLQLPFAMMVGCDSLDESLGFITSDLDVLDESSG